MAGWRRRLRGIAGIPVEIPASGILGVVLLAYLWVPAFAPDSARNPWILAVAFAVLLSLATLAHEFAHALVARAFGFPVHRVVLQLLGGVTHYERSRQAPMAEATVAAAGPIVTFAVAGVSYAATRVLDPESAAAVLARALTWANVLIGVYNSLPGIPLDGGNVLRCLIWAVTGSERRGTVIAGWVGSGRGAAHPPLAADPLGGDRRRARPRSCTWWPASLAAMLYTGATAQLPRARHPGPGTRADRGRPGPQGDSRSSATCRWPRRCAGRRPGAPVPWWSWTPGARRSGIGQHDAIAAVPEQRRPWVSVASVARPIDAESYDRPRPGRDRPRRRGVAPGPPGAARGRSARAGSTACCCWPTWRRRCAGRAAGRCPHRVDQ